MPIEPNEMVERAADLGERIAPFDFHRWRGGILRFPAVPPGAFGRR